MEGTGLSTGERAGGRRFHERSGREELFSLELELEIEGTGVSTGEENEILFEGESGVCGRLLVEMEGMICLICGGLGSDRLSSCCTDFGTFLSGSRGGRICLMFTGR